LAKLEAALAQEKKDHKADKELAKKENDESEKKI